MNNIQSIGHQVLYGLIEAQKVNHPYYVKDRFDEILQLEDDVFLNDDDIIKHVQKILSDNYKLEVIPVQREFVCKHPKDNFFYADIELKLIEND